MFKIGKDYSFDELKDMIYNMRKQEEKKSKAWIWIAVGAIVALVGAGVFVWYKFLRHDDFYDDFDDYNEYDYDDFDEDYEDEDYEDYEEDFEDVRDYGIVYEDESVVVDEEPADVVMEKAVAEAAEDASEESATDTDEDDALKF